MMSNVWARRAMIDMASDAAGEGGLVLEGAAPPLARFDSLDQCIAGEAFSWIDEEAERIASDWATPRDDAPTDDQLDRCRLPWILARSLRYYGVRLLRPVAYALDVARWGERDRVVLTIESPKDDDYAMVFRALAAARGFTLSIRAQPGETATPPVTPRNALWRRTLGAVASLLEPRPTVAPLPSQPCLCGQRQPIRPRNASAPRAVLVGNRRILDPVCAEWVGRGGEAFWLYDRFSPGAWLSWRLRGVGQRWCDSDQLQASGLRVPSERMVQSRGVALSDACEAWLCQRQRIDGARLTRLWTRIGEHLAELRPQVVILDEDATSMARCVLAHARQMDIRTVVVQHGACCCRFGFVPLEADRFLAWDEPSRRQMVAWGAPAERIVVTGPAAPVRLPPREQSGERDERHLLLCTTAAPDDRRPDAIALHLTSQTYAMMLRAALDGTTLWQRRSGQIARLSIRPHPRDGDRRLIEDLLDAHNEIDGHVVVGGPLAAQLRYRPIILACLSSVAVELARQGIPVIQILPEGSASILPANQYGMVGTARTAEEVCHWLQHSETWESPPPSEEASSGAREIVDATICLL